MFIELTDSYGFKFLANTTKIETIYGATKGCSLGFGPESGSVVIKESYEEIKSIIEHERQQQK